MKPYKPPISTEKTPDDVCRIAVQLALSPRRSKSVREIAKLCNLGISTVRRHLKNLIAEGYAKRIRRGRGTRYLSSSPKEAAIERELARLRPTPEQLEKGMADIRDYLEEQRQRWLKNRRLLKLRNDARHRRVQ